MSNSWILDKSFRKSKNYNNLSKSSLSASLVQVSESEKSKSSRLLCRQHGPWKSSVSSQCSYSSLWCSRSISDGKRVSHALHLLGVREKKRKFIAKQPSRLQVKSFNDWQVEFFIDARELKRVVRFVSVTVLWHFSL